MTEIITRAEWGARLPRCTTAEPNVTELFLHHSVGSTNQDKDGDGDKGDDYMRQMQAQHMAPGWAGTVDGGCDGAYNHAHDPDGAEFYEGRGFGVRPGAQCGHNAGTHALVVMDDFRSRTVTAQLKADIAGFYIVAITEGLLPNVTVKGHRDAPITGSCGGTTCPGTNLYAALPEINQLIQEGLDMPLTDEDIEKVAERAAAHVWGGYEIQGRHANTILRDINGDTDFLRSQSVKTMTEAQLQAVATAVADELHRRGAE